MFFPGRAGLMFSTLQRSITTFQRSTRLSARAYHGHFSSTDGTLWKRKLDGSEDFFACLAHVGAGYGQFTAEIEVKPAKQPVSESALLESVRKAWIRLRFLAPKIALRTDIEPGSDGKAFFISYESPKSNQAVISKWADETIKWHPEEKTLVERDLDLKEIWRSPDGCWNMEMHVGRCPGGNIQLMFSGVHWASDGHLALDILDKLSEYLAVELEGKSNNIEELPWGEEIPQLPPSIFAVISPEYRGEVAPPLPQLAGTPNFFRRPIYSAEPADSTSHSDLSHPITLTAAQTQAFRAKCKANGFKVTPVITTIAVLAEIEAALKTAIWKGPDAFKAVHDAFLSADGFFIPVNPGNRRAAFLPEHRSLTSSLGTPGVASEAFPTVHDMNPIRKCIRINDDMDVERVMSQEAFWDGAVQNAHDIFAPGARIPPHFLAYQRALSAESAVRANEMLDGGVLVSSMGDFDRANIWNRWRPSNRTQNSSDADNTTVPALTIERLIISARMTTPTVNVIHWQYDGKFTIHLHGLRRFHDEHAWKDFTHAFESRVLDIVEGRS
ncbi:hypothetical protein FIBSPDRAFT_938641 [Athelia psychrophila]|uniref:CoA-dependent acyltransferase n=1 Tax=Athelia psychrophila TaxID=1759441 RepID=A0A165Y206_9AGAM|nr:hypothetical protein FIBSPDRAFT_938641 [Fibularhizoctonia sp. CBS 109695]